MPLYTTSYIQSVADGLTAVLMDIGELWMPQDDAGECRWSPRDLDSLPAAVIELPTVRRPEPDEADIVPLESMSLILEFPVTFYFDLSEAGSTQLDAVAYVEAALLAIGFDPSLQVAGVIDSTMVAAEPTIVEDRTRAMVAYECQVHVLMAVPDPDP